MAAFYVMHDYVAVHAMGWHGRLPFSKRSMLPVGWQKTA